MDKQTQLRKLLNETYYGDIAELVRDIEAIKDFGPFAEKKNVISTEPVIVSVSNLSKKYKRGKTMVNAVDDVSLEVRKGEIVALVGTSGSGKSTVLNLIGGLDKPTSGSIEVDGVDITKLKDSKLAMYRGQKIGFVFQFFYLQPFLNVQSNMELPAVFNRTKFKDRHDKSSEMANSVGMQDRLTHLPKELSGGQMQRAAIARALVNNPTLLLADEPTGNLDSANASAIFDLFASIRDKFGTTVIVVTHDQSLASRADRTISLSDGKVVG